MLFDLRGRRRRAVQGTYLRLALLMGGGLVLFGIGGDVSGGLFDAFSERGGGGGNDAVEERVERNEDRLRANPNNEAALKELVRDYYGLAVSQQESGATQFSADAKDELRKAGAYWERYLEAESGEPDPSLALVAWRIFDLGALNRPAGAARAMAIIAADSNDPQHYLQLVQYAALAGDERTADLASQKAVDLAPNNLRMEVKKQAEQIKKAAKQQQAAG
ncbi:MAG TPA: hypothetical protein VFQ12_07165 [Thermoleophilaceae bacterium]|nr:hypothetical protein [Thermoleophilaceae bacterium]